MLDHFLHIAQSMPEFCLFTILYTSLQNITFFTKELQSLTLRYNVT